MARSATVELGGRDQRNDLYLRLLSDLQSIVDFDSKVSDGAFQLGMAEKKLDGSEIPGPPVDQRGFGAAH